MVMRDSIDFEDGQPIGPNDRVLGFTDAETASAIVGKHEDISDVIERIVGKRVVSTTHSGDDLTVTYSDGTSETFAVGQTVDLSDYYDKQEVNTLIANATRDPGPAGHNGYSPVLAVRPDGERRVLQIANWVGGNGPKPDTGGYLGTTGIVSDIAQASDIRGPQGQKGDKGDIESGVTAEQLQEERDARKAGDDPQAIVVASASSYQSALNQQATSEQPLTIEITADISGTRGGSPYSWSEGDILEFAPNSDSPERLFNINSGSANVQDATITPPSTVSKGLFTQDIYDFLAARDQWVGYGITSAAQLHQILTDSANMKQARLLFFDKAVNEVHQSVTYAHTRNLVGYALPGESTVTNLFRVTDTKIKHAGTEAELTTLLATHTQENTDLFVYINAGFRHSGTTYVKGSWVSFKPESVTPVVEIRQPVNPASIRIEPPSIAAPADLDGDYVLFLGTPDYSNAEVDQLEIWFKDEAVHSVSPFAPESGPFVIPFNISTSEETQIGLTNSDDYVRVLAVYRKSGQYVGQDTTVLAVKNQVPAPSGGGTPADDSVGTDQLKDHAVTGTKIARGTITSSNLSIAEQIQLLNPWIDPVRSEVGGAYNVQLPGSGGVTTGNFVQVELNGRRVGSRVAWTQQGTFTVTPTTADVTAISSVSTERVIVAVAFYSEASGGNILGVAITVTSVGEKGPAGTSITLTRYANEAAVPATVPANTIAWWPA